MKWNHTNSATSANQLTTGISFMNRNLKETAVILYKKQLHLEVYNLFLISVSEYTYTVDDN